MDDARSARRFKRLPDLLSYLSFHRRSDQVRRLGSDSGLLLFAPLLARGASGHRARARDLDRRLGPKGPSPGTSQASRLDVSDLAVRLGHGRDRLRHALSSLSERVVAEKLPLTPWPLLL